jgi:hypothetical protein
MISLDQFLRTAVVSHMTIAFSYDGLERIACPVVYGAIKQGAGVLAYQFGGASRSGDLPDWRLFYTDRMIDVRESPLQPPPLPDFTLRDPRFEDVYATLPPRLRRD